MKLQPCVQTVKDDTHHQLQCCITDSAHVRDHESSGFSHRSAFATSHGGTKEAFRRAEIHTKQHYQPPVLRSCQTSRQVADVLHLDDTTLVAFWSEHRRGIKICVKPSSDEAPSTSSQRFAYQFGKRFIPRKKICPLSQHTQDVQGTRHRVHRRQLYSNGVSVPDLR